MFFRRTQSAECEAALLQRAAAWTELTTLESLIPERLQQITRQEGVDFATALLFDRFRSVPEHAAFIQRVDDLRQGSLRLPEAFRAKVVVVPGALYVERPDLGGDGRLVREVAEGLGCPSDVVPLASRGSVVENARRLNAWLAQQRDEPIILVSLSKGGADVKMALAAPESAHSFRNAVAWVNACGPLDGSRLVNWIFDGWLRRNICRLQYRWQQRDFRFITDLRHGPGGILDFSVALPPKMKLVSLVGFPLRRHLTTPFSRFCHRTLAAWGPNDGTTLLSDLRGWPGEIYPVWGVDHYFRPQGVARRLITTVLRFLAEEHVSRVDEERRMTPVL